MMRVLAEMEICKRTMLRVHGHPPAMQRFAIFLESISVYPMFTGTCSGILQNAEDWTRGHGYSSTAIVHVFHVSSFRSYYYYSREKREIWAQCRAS